ncbi:MAG: hypothetical protein QM817_40740 [Archangium sp.]
MDSFSGVKVFSATKAEDRLALGERIMTWMQQYPNLEIVERNVLLSSDDSFHCLTIVFFYRERAS